MKLISRLTAFTAILLCAACASTPRQAPVTLSATGFAQSDPKVPAAIAYSQARKMAELRARQQLEESVKTYRVDANQSLQQLIVVDPFVRAVFDDTIRSARVSDRTVKPDGSVSVTVDLDLNQLSQMLGKPVTGPGETQPANK
ncbi:hypothetical protein LLG95_03620 [bacterium]|nr:hypothetical protein [bacterium]